MKRYLSLYLLLFATTFFTFGQVPGEKKWKENLSKNRIQSQVQWNHKYVKGKPAKTGYINFSKKFDHKGNVIEEIYYQSGSIDQKLSYKYDKNENKIEFVNYNGNENEIMFKQNITYDNSALKIREERYNGVDYQIIKYSYNNNNQLEKIVRSDIYGNVEHMRVFTYTDNKCNIDIFSDKTSKTGNIVNTFDSNFNIIETIEYDRRGNIIEQYKFSFKNNLLAKKTKYVQDNFIYTETYEYDSNKNLVKILKEQPEGKIVTNNIYTYDSYGNLIEEQWYDNDPNDYSKKSYYYTNNNILERVEVYYSSYKYKIQYKYEYETY